MRGTKLEELCTRGTRILVGAPLGFSVHRKPLNLNNDDPKGLIFWASLSYGFLQLLRTREMTISVRTKLRETYNNAFHQLSIFCNRAASVDAPESFLLNQERRIKQVVIGFLSIAQSNMCFCRFLKAVVLQMD